jgi:CRP-like cAMP-binding protein
MDVTDIATVKKTLLFGHLSDRSIVDIVGHSLPVAYPKGRLLFQEGEAVEGVPIVLSGWVRLFRIHMNGTEATVRICGPAHGFAEPSVLLDRPVDLNAETISDARILWIEAERLRARLVSDPDVAFAALASASIHLRNLVQDLQQLKTLSVVRRIAHFLLEATGATEGPAELRLPYEKSLIAGHIGMTAESFSRGLAALRAHGVTSHRDVVSIERVERLMRVVRGAT